MIVFDQVHVVWRSRQLLVVHPVSEDVQRGAMHRSTSARVNFSMSMSTCAAKTFKFLNVNVNPPTSQTDQLSDLPWENCTGLDLCKYFLFRLDVALMQLMFLLNLFVSVILMIVFGRSSRQKCAVLRTSSVDPSFFSLHHFSSNPRRTQSRENNCL